MPLPTDSTRSLHGLLKAIVESVMYANHQSALQAFEAMKAMGFSESGPAKLGEAKYLEFESEITDVQGPVRQIVRLPLLSVISPKTIGIKDAEIKFQVYADIEGLASAEEQVLKPEPGSGAFADCIGLSISGERKEAGTIAVEMKINVSEIPVSTGLKRLMDSLSESHLRKHVRKEE